MEKITDIIQWAVDIIADYPPIVLAVFGVSVLANITQIGTYLSSRIRIKKEQAEKQKLSRLVETYEDVLLIAKEQVEDKNALASLKKEIKEKSTLAQDLSQKIKQLENSAQKSLVQKAIEYNVNTLKTAYDEIKRLQEQYRNLGVTADIPLDKKKAIENQIKLTIQNPYEFPKEFMFRSILLVLFILLLPWPVEGLLLPFVLRFFLETFFDAVKMFPNPNVKKLVYRHYSLIIFLATLGIWNGFFNAFSDTCRALFSTAIWIEISDFYMMALWPITLAFTLVVWRQLKELIKVNRLAELEEPKE